MQRLSTGFTRVLSTVAVVCSIGALSAPVARAQSLQYQSVPNTRGSITGVVSDDHGGPIAGAMVSALGTVTVAKALTDASGYFSIDALPVGDYTVQAHRNGFRRLGARDRARERPLARPAAPPAASPQWSSRHHGNHASRPRAADHGCRLWSACRYARRPA